LPAAVAGYLCFSCLDVLQACLIGNEGLYNCLTQEVCPAAQIIGLAAKFLKVHISELSHFLNG
jgi:hypothetical protein